MNMATAPVNVPAVSCTLYDLEDQLQALVSSIDSEEEPAVRASILEQIGHALKRTKEKRDAVVQFLRHCESQQRFADLEIDRIQKRKTFIARPERAGILSDQRRGGIRSTRSTRYTAARR